VVRPGPVMELTSSAMPPQKPIVGLRRIIAADLHSARANKAPSRRRRRGSESWPLLGCPFSLTCCASPENSVWLISTLLKIGHTQRPLCQPHTRADLRNGSAIIGRRREQQTKSSDDLL
jgi:hypothetical protein